MNDSSTLPPLPPLNGGLLLHKPTGMSSSAALGKLKKLLRKSYAVRRSRDLPKIGHGGTLDPFATGLLVAYLGQGTKLSRYSLGSSKTYTCVIRFGESNLAGDPTEAITETSSNRPTRSSLEAHLARMESEPYYQTPPMHSAKKKDGKRLYDLARKGVTVHRDPILCHLTDLRLLEVEMVSSSDHRVLRCQIEVTCSSGTYIRTLAQDLARELGTVGMTETLSRVAVGDFHIGNAISLNTLEQIDLQESPLPSLKAWLSLTDLVPQLPRVDVGLDQARLLKNGYQSRLGLMARGLPQERSEFAICHQKDLLAIASRQEQDWTLSRVFNASGV